MTRFTRIAALIALPGLAISASAQAGATRASDLKLGPACGTGGRPACATAQGQQPAEVGPPNGFPDTPGLDRARRVASDRAAFNRDDSPGG